MKIRALGEGDLHALSEFILDAYHDYPLAMWFKEEPTQSQLESIFYNKIKSMGSRDLIDIVTEENGTIAGECEIAKIDFGSGIIGILVRHGYRSKSIGSEMMRMAIDDAVDIGITKFTAEVAQENADALKFFLRNGFVPIGYRKIESGDALRTVAVLQHAIR